MGFLDDIGKTIGDFIGGFSGGGSPKPPTGGGLNPPLARPKIAPGQVTYQPVKGKSGTSGSSSYNRSSPNYNRKKNPNKAYSAMQKSRRRIIRPKLQKISRPTRSIKQTSQKPQQDLIQNAISIATNFNPVAHLNQFIGDTTKSTINLIENIVPKDTPKKTPSSPKRTSASNISSGRSRIQMQQKAMGSFNRKVDFGRVGTGSTERYHTFFVGLGPQRGTSGKTIKKHPLMNMNKPPKLIPHSQILKNTSIDFGKVGTKGNEQYFTIFRSPSPQKQNIPTKTKKSYDIIGGFFSPLSHDLLPSQNKPVLMPDLRQIGPVLQGTMSGVGRTLSHLSPVQPVQAHPLQQIAKRTKTSRQPKRTKTIFSVPQLPKQFSTL